MYQPFGTCSMYSSSIICMYVQPCKSMVAITVILSSQLRLDGTKQLFDYDDISPSVLNVSAAYM